MTTTLHSTRDCRSNFWLYCQRTGINFRAYRTNGSEMGKGIRTVICERNPGVEPPVRMGEYHGCCAWNAMEQAVRKL